MAERSWKSKLTLGDLGIPANVKVMSAEDLAKSGGKYVMGYLIGKAGGVVERSNPKDGTVMEGLKGSFVMMPSDPQRDELESGVLFIPDAFHNLVADKLRETLKTDENGTVEFAFEVCSVPAKNPAGYSWQFQPALPFAGTHVLADTLAKITAIKQKALEAPRKSR